ncbi:MAG: cell wall metabolism sensor histidine kinase WalK, partial [Clostridiales bacterium]|nr:cell wall metabolism sensor histidine kinase WalK [Clostridiales bacterium]
MSIYIKNFTITAVLVVLSFFILGASFVVLGRGFALNETKQGIALSAQEVSRSAGAFMDSGELSSWNLRLIISTVARSTGNQIFITDSNGIIVSTSETELLSDNIGKRLTDSVMAELQEFGRINEMTTLGNFYRGRQFYVVALPIT